MIWECKGAFRLQTAFIVKVGAWAAPSRPDLPGRQLTCTLGRKPVMRLGASQEGQGRRWITRCAVALSIHLYNFQFIDIASQKEQGRRSAGIRHALQSVRSFHQSGSLICSTYRLGACTGTVKAGAWAKAETRVAARARLGMHSIAPTASCHLVAARNSKLRCLTV